MKCSNKLSGKLQNNDRLVSKMIFSATAEHPNSAQTYTQWFLSKKITNFGKFILKEHQTIRTFARVMSDPFDVSEEYFCNFVIPNVQFG